MDYNDNTILALFPPSKKNGAESASRASGFVAAAKKGAPEKRRTTEKRCTKLRLAASNNLAR